MTLHHRDLVTRLQASLMQLSSSGPRVSACHADGQILLLAHMPQPTPLEYMKTSFQPPYHGMMVDAINVFAGRSDYM
jgi:hypothetical protein